MGRKIPGKKHRGVKDPYKQHAERLATLKAKINKTPIRPDEQPIPKSLIRLMNWNKKKVARSDKDNDSNKSPKSTLKKNFSAKKTLDKNISNPLKRLQKLDGESKKSFNTRINDALKTLKKDTTFDDILNDVPEENDRKRKNSDGETLPRRKRRKVDKEVKLSKSQKRTQRDKLKKEEIKEKKEYDKLYVVRKDDIKFGEVVHEPPSLKIKPRKATVADGAPRPARKDLLLNKYFENINTQSIPMSDNSVRDNTLQNVKKQGIDLKGKRKDLPDNIRKRLEQSQREAVEAYKRLKLTSLRQHVQ